MFQPIFERRLGELNEPYGVVSLFQIRGLFLEVPEIRNPVSAKGFGFTLGIRIALCR